MSQFDFRRHRPGAHRGPTIRFMRDTGYAEELAYADLGGKRIERIFIKRTLCQAIRLSAWRRNQICSRPLVVSEDELLILMGDAIAAMVFPLHS